MRKRRIAGSRNAVWRMACVDTDHREAKLFELGPQPFCLGPVSRPIRIVPGTFDLTNAAIASGSESTRLLSRSIPPGSPHRSRSASTIRPVQPLPLSIFARQSRIPESSGVRHKGQAPSTHTADADSRIFGNTSGKQVCPENPGLTVITRTMSHRCCGVPPLQLSCARSAISGRSPAFRRRPRPPTRFSATGIATVAS